MSNDNKEYVLWNISGIYVSFVKADGSYGLGVRWSARRWKSRTGAEKALARLRSCNPQGAIALKIKEV